MIETILRDLRQPEYLHVLLNPLPIYGLMIALFGCSRRRTCEARRTADRAYPDFRQLPFHLAVKYHGDQAYDRIMVMADEDGQAWLKAHEHRADQLAIFIRARAGFRGRDLRTEEWPSSARPLVYVTMLLAAVSLGAGFCIAYAGGKIRHREFRTVPPPKTPESESR